MSDDWGSCQNCGRLLWKDGGPGYDDVVSQPYVTESGDVYCIPCGRAADEAEREHGDDCSCPDCNPYPGDVL